MHQRLLQPTVNNNNSSNHNNNVGEQGTVRAASWSYEDGGQNDNEVRDLQLAVNLAGDKVRQVGCIL